ncbi:formylglycine-generating enzyme family protein [Roseomonas sp. WA12]
MVWVAGGTFRMGSDRHYPEEAPAHDRSVEGFWMDRAPVTQGEFARFVVATGYRTVAERPPRPEDYPGADPALLVAGSVVFQAPRSANDMRFWGDWWAFRPGASWRNPDGNSGAPEPSHPVVHVCHEDALAYANWVGKRLPTEAEWEFAAHGAVPGAEFAWGDEFAPGGAHFANTWQGNFPYENQVADCYAGTSPVGSFPPNQYGLVDLIGNVWEWTAEDWVPGHLRESMKSCCVPDRLLTRSEPEASVSANYIPRKVIKGGSHLCAPNYCHRYRPAARQGQSVETGTSHIGFRCVK